MVVILRSPQGRVYSAGPFSGHGRRARMLDLLARAQARGWTVLFRDAEAVSQSVALSLIEPR
jgi:hypothetical protein